MILARDQQSASVLLPHTGVQQILVNAAGAASTYRLQVAQSRAGL